MTDIIKLLKKNKYPFGMWPEPECYGKEVGEEMQAKARGIGKKEFQFYSMNGWENPARDDNFCSYNVFRLRPDYKDELEIVECEITLNPESNIWCYRCPCSNDLVNADSAHSCPGYRLSGFKFEDGKMYPISTVYKFKNKLITYYSIDIDRLDEYEVLHATHVLFRRPK